MSSVLQRVALKKVMLVRVTCIFLSCPHIVLECCYTHGHIVLQPGWLIVSFTFCVLPHNGYPDENVLAKATHHI